MGWTAQHASAHCGSRVILENQSSPTRFARVGDLIPIGLNALTSICGRVPSARTAIRRACSNPSVMPGHPCQTSERTRSPVGMISLPTVSRFALDDRGLPDDAIRYLLQRARVDPILNW